MGDIINLHWRRQLGKWDWSIRIPISPGVKIQLRNKYQFGPFLSVPGGIATTGITVSKDMVVSGRPIFFRLAGGGIGVGGLKVTSKLDNDERVGRGGINIVSHLKNSYRA